MNRIPPFVLALACLCIAAASPARSAERVYYIAAEEVAWDYAPSFPTNPMTGRPFDETARTFVAGGPTRIGHRYRKSIYRQYADAMFSVRIPKPVHLGVLGPVIRAEVGDTIAVHFLNRTRYPASVHPHGLFYDKASEGTPYADGSAEGSKADDVVAPGASYTYRWRVPERAGPGAADPSSIAWPYHSHVDEPADTNAGLVGAIIVTARGKARADGRPADVDREFVALFAVFDENASLYRDDNIAAFTTAPVDPDDDAFVESNLMHGVNGRLWGNLEGLKMRVGERVRWHVFAMGTEVDLHTPHWHGATLLAAGRRVDVAQLMPAATRTLDMRPDSPGRWMFHCHVNDHIEAGMMVTYDVAK